MIDRFRASATATATAVALALTGCGAHTIAPGPLSLGSGEPEPHMNTCVADLGPTGSFFAGDRLRNDTEQTFRITAATADSVEGLTITALTGRRMAADDPHFLAFSSGGLSDPQFARAVADTTPLVGLDIAPGETIGLVVESTLDFVDVGSFASITVTYESEGQSYQNSSSVSFQGAARSCPDWR